MSFLRRTFPPQISDVLPRFYWPLMALLCVAYCWRPLSGGDDIWAHAAIGRWIVENKMLPQQSLFLWSTPPIPWVYHSWLSQITFYNLLSTGENFGPVAVVLFTSTLVVITFTLLWRAWSTRVEGVSPIMIAVFALAIYCSALRFTPRPELFSALFLCVLLLLLSRMQSALSLRGVLGVGTLFVIWTNFHGGVAVGLLLLGATVFCEIVQQKFAPISWRFLALILIAFLAVCLNPYGLNYWQALRPVGGEMFQRIDEWKPFWKDPILNPLLVIGEATLVWMAFLSWVGNDKRRWSNLAWLLIMAALFVSARRHLWLLPITCLAVLAENSATLSTPRLLQSMRVQSEQIPASRRGLVRALMIGVLCVAIARATPSKVFSAQWLQPKVPRKAADFFLKNSAISKTRIFNDYENSSFLQWKFGGKPPLYIDLLNAYPDRLLLDYLDIVHANSKGQKLLENQKIQTVFVRAYKPDSSLAKLAKYLEKEKTRWQRVYRAGDGTIWIRRKAVIQREAVNSAR